MQMEEEVETFIKVWTTAISSVCICFYLMPRIPAGFLRLLSLLPIIFLFILLPFNLYSIHLGSPTLFYLTWLANFKLLLFSFHHGPLSSKTPLSLLHFISLALLPIKVKHEMNPDFKSHTVPSLQMTPPAIPNKNPSQNLDKSQDPYLKFTKEVHKSIILVIKAVLLCLVMRLYDYRQYLEPHLILVVYCFHVYLGVELTLAITVVPVQTFLGLDLEPQFDKPYLATSLQDFWSRRWNLMVTSILRPAVYVPVGRVATCLVGRSWGQAAGCLTTFLVSGLMHEMMYFHWTRVAPTWEVTWFFVLHGVCTAVEVEAKRAIPGEWRLHRAVSGPLTLGFVVLTGYWLFFPQMIRNGLDVKAVDEFWMTANFVKGLFG